MKIKYSDVAAYIEHEKISYNAVSTPYFARKMQTHESSSLEQNLPPDLQR